MTAEERADMLNEMQSIAEKYGFVVAGYDDSGNLFEVIMMHDDEVEHSQEADL